MAQKKNLKQKLAVAMSVVNALNVGAAVALPYANMTKSIVADGAKIERLVDGVAGAMYGTAHAERITSTITNGQTYKDNSVTDFDLIVEAGGQTSNVSVRGTETTSGVVIVHNGGTTKDTTTEPGGVLELHSGARLRVDGTAGDIEYNQYVLNGGTLRLKEDTAGQYVEIANYHITNGTLELANGGKATGTRLDAAGGNHGVEVIKNGGLSQQGIINNGGTQIVGNGGLSEGAFVNEGGTQTIENGGTSKQANINGGTQIVKNGGLSQQSTLNDGLQTIEKGGTSENTTVKGGTQKIEAGGMATSTTISAGGVQTLQKGTPNSPGGVSEKITLKNGGTLNVNDYAKAQIDAATGGTLNLFDTGLATAEFGNATTIANFTLTNLNASNDTVILGMGNDATAVVGKNLTIGTMKGNAKFVINTDIAKNKSDTITINNVTGTSQNTVQINYDPTLATNKTVPTNTLVATVKAGTATFTGVESTVGGFHFTPLITSKGNSWYITGFENAGPSEQMYASLDTATWQAIAWRDSNFVIGSRMAQLHHDPSSAHQNDFWVDFTRGRNRTNNFGHAMNRTYDRVSVGYDRLVGHGWTVGLAYGYEKGTEGYEKGSGDSTGNVVTAYATWQGANGNYVDMTIKGGQLESDFTVQDDNQVTPSKADTRATGAGVSAVFGHRFENASAFYVEPHAGFYWSHLGGYDYRLSDGSDVSVDGCNSFVGNLGVNVGKRLGKGEVYARADFMHDFSGNVRVSMTKAGLNNTMENPLHDSWLNVAVGYRQNYDRVGWYAEAGCQSIGSRESSGDWVWKAGVEFKF